MIFLDWTSVGIIFYLNFELKLPPFPSHKYFSMIKYQLRYLTLRNFFLWRTAVHFSLSNVGETSLKLFSNRIPCLRRFSILEKSTLNWEQWQNFLSPSFSNFHSENVRVSLCVTLWEKGPSESNYDFWVGYEILCIKGCRILLNE